LCDACAGWRSLIPTGPDFGPADHVAGHILRALLGPVPDEAADGLASFQRDAVMRLSTIIDEYRGALLCDSVGLGKTHVAAALIRSAALRGTVLVTAPAQLRTLWTRQLRNVPNWNWVSHTSLSRGTLPRIRSPHSLIVVDEAHAFRNPDTRRYRALALGIGASPLLLVTATPVNNSLLDFYHLVRLFAADDAFAGIGVPDLRAAIERGEVRRSDELLRVVQAVMVRRTRESVRVWTAADSTPHAPALRFPACAGTQLLPVPLDAAYSAFLDSARTILQNLDFTPYHIARGSIAADLLRIGFLKRLESSATAFHASISRLLRITASFVAAARAGLWFDPRTDAHLARDVDGSVQLMLQQLALAPWPVRHSRTAALDAAARDVAALELVRRAALDVTRQEPKFELVASLLAGELAHDRVLIFTEFRDTGIALWRRLAPVPGIALIHGSDARLGRSSASRRVVIDRFAPLANGARPPRASEAVHALIATDVIAEGMNLQDARVVISLDLPWNPVRLAQRAGRIDRIGSPHTDIRVIAFAPPPPVEAMIDLVGRLRRKVARIQAVGGDAPPPFRRRVVAARSRWDRIADARELARIALVRTPPPQTPHRRAILITDAPEPAALCCVAVDRQSVLLHVDHAAVVTVADDTAWMALRDAIVHVDAPATVNPASFPRAAALLHAAECAALEFIGRPVHSHTPDSVDAAARRRAARTIRSSLAPDAADSDFSDVDAALRFLARPMRAGDAARFRDTLIDCNSEFTLVQRLARLHRSRTPPADSKPPTLVASLLLFPAR
jgi:superfamily II DNA or RNA helicase